MSIPFITRAAAGLPATTPCSGAMAGTIDGVVIHHMGPGRWAHQTPEHMAREIRRWHLSGSGGYCDISYSILVSANMSRRGIVEARSTAARPRVRPGANGNRTANERSYALAVTSGTGDPPPSEQLLQDIAAGVRWLRARGAGRAITPHSQHIATACPGDPLRNALPRIRQLADQDGAPPSAPPPPGSPQPPTGADVPVVILINHGGHRWASYPAAGIRRRIQNPTQETNIRAITQRAGGRVIEWAQGQNVDDPNAFGQVVPW